MGFHGRVLLRILFDAVGGSLNRISQANTVTTTGSNCWGEVYTIDAWSNLTNIAGPAGMTGCVTEPLNAAPATSQNRLTGLLYDIAGNVLNDGKGNQPTYDAESRIATVAGCPSIRAKALSRA